MIQYFMEYNFIKEISRNDSKILLFNYCIKRFLSVTDAHNRNNLPMKLLARNETRNLIAKEKLKYRRKDFISDPNTINHEYLFGLAPSYVALKHCRRKIHKAFLQKSILFSNRKEIQEIKFMLSKNKVETVSVERTFLDYVCGGRPHQGVVLETGKLFFEEVKNEEWKTQKKSKFRHGPSLWLLLDRIKDPMNFGAILRTAYFFGVDRVLTSYKHSCPLTPVVSKASSGTMELMPVYRFEKLSSLLKYSKEAGWTIIGTSNRSEETKSTFIDHYNFDFTSAPLLLCLGNEGEGLSSDLLEDCDLIVHLHPGRDLETSIESLNVSVATGILLHSLIWKKSKAD